MPRQQFIRHDDSIGRTVGITQLAWLDLEMLAELGHAFGNGGRKIGDHAAPPIIWPVSTSSISFSLATGKAPVLWQCVAIR